jgi:hypothetical protein
MAPLAEGTARGNGLAASFVKAGQAQAMGDADYADMIPVITTLASGVVDANTSIIERQFTVDANSWSVRFTLISDERAHIALRVYDPNGNCVGYDTSKGGVQNEFIAKYIGKETGHQDVDIPASAGKTYTVKAVLEGADANEAFSVQLLAFETPIRPAVLAVTPASIVLGTEPNATIDLPVTIGEAGQQQPLHGVTVSLSPLTHSNGSANLLIIGNTQYDINAMPAASAKSISFTVSVGQAMPCGDYTGEITIVSSNSGIIAVPVTISVKRIADLTNDCIVNLYDLAAFSVQWLKENCVEPDWCEGADLNVSTNVDFYDFAEFANNWLKGL